MSDFEPGSGGLRPDPGATALRLVQLEEAIAHVPWGMAVFDATLRCVALNPELAAAGRDGGPVPLGRPLEAMPAVPWARLAPLARRALAGEAVRGAALSLELPGGLRHWSVHAYPLHGRGDAVLGVAVVAQDDTQRRLDEHEHQAIVELVEHSRDFIALADLEGRVRYMNPAGRALMGLSPDSALGYPVERHLPHEQVRQWREVVQPRLRSHGHWTGDMELVRQDDGRRIEVQRDFFLVRDRHTLEALGYGSVTRDVSQTRRVERALRDSQTRLDLALNAAEIGLFEWDIASGERSWSPHHYLIFGLAPGAGPVTHQLFEERLHPDDRERFSRALAEALAGRPVFELEYRIVRPSGDVRTLTSTANIEYDDAGYARRVTGVVVDITERRAATEELARRERQFASLMANSPDVFARFDRELRISYVSPAIERFAGVSAADLLGRPLSALGLEPFVRARWETTLRRVAERGRAERFAFSWTRSGGRTRQHEVRLMPEGGDGGEVESVLSIVSDVTDRHLAEQALREADRRKDEFLATLAHELRNPLAPLRNGLELLLGRPGDAAVAEHVGQMMQRQLRQLVHLVDDLLDVGRITRGRLELRREPVLLSELVDNVLEIGRPALQAGRQELVLTLPPQPVRLDVDPTRLAQVATNLLHNAARYTPEGGRIELAFTVDGPDLAMTVRDNGVGIPRAMLERVFDLFTQAEAGERRGQGGLGIGLTLVRRLVELHGGTVTAHSDGPGRGSTFRAVLPVVVAAPTHDEDDMTTQAADPAPTAPMSVLVVDDNRDSAETLALVLELSGHRVATAHDGAQALAMAERGVPEVAVLDIGLPDMSGHELARRLRALPGGEEILLVAVTGWGQTQDRDRSVAAGFDHHLVKPVDPGRLEALLAQRRPPPG